jgi:hypothetical protein
MKNHPKKSKWKSISLKKCAFLKTAPNGASLKKANAGFQAALFPLFKMDREL